MLFRVYDAIKLRCPFAHAHQCEWTGSPSTLHEHITVCEQKSVAFAPTAQPATCNGSCSRAVQLRAELEQTRNLLAVSDRSRDNLEFEWVQLVTCTKIFISKLILLR
jgi:hypothetical protein